MGLYTGTVKGLSRAPYSDQVIVYLMNFGHNITKLDDLTDKERAKIDRVRRFLPAYDCAQEIHLARNPKW